ncbi:MAG: type II secretion system protein M [Sedimentisphaerales bacterium]|nr:type II secretion system protein M [Sedimentisphaerales bacterium]
MVLITTYKKYLKVSAVVWLICLVVFVLAYLFVMSPQNKKREDAEKELVNLQQEYKMAQKAAQEETKARLNEEIELLQKKLNSFVLDNKSAADLTFDLGKIADESKITSFNVQSYDAQNSSVSADPNNIFEKHIKVSFVAGFQEFALFLNTLERHQPVLFINEFMLSSQNKDKATFQVILDVASFVQKQQAAIAKDVVAEKVTDTKL